MRRDKRERWALNRELDCVHEPDQKVIACEGGSYMRGEWRSRAFGADRPITLELGCGQGLFSVDLARRFPEQSFIGIDIKGHRYWRGAQVATDQGVTNIAFLRMRIQWLNRFFAKDEVDDAWLTFSDPQVADKRGTKCLVSPYYLTLYEHVLRPGGRLRVKTDSPEFFARAQESVAATGMSVVDACEDVHGAPEGRFGEELTKSLAFTTAFEERWIKEGRSIHYLELAAPEAADSDSDSEGGDGDDRLDEALRMLQGPAARDRPRFYGC